MVTAICIIFILGYAAIALEHPVKINKAATALVTAALCWSLYALLSGNGHAAAERLTTHLGDISGILFFLMGAMTIVELIDAHDGFYIITSRIKTTNKKKLVWLIAFVTFFLSAVLDNLTTTIVLVSLLRKIIADKEDRMLFTALVVIAANAGGAWSPIGDVTTTMLWIGGQITAGSIIIQTFLPSLASMLIPAVLISRKMKGEVKRPADADQPGVNFNNNAFERNLVFGVGICSLLFVPVFKTLTHLPPYMGILFGLGVMWIITELIHSGRDEEEKGLFSVNHALRKIDTPSILFFLGILLSIGALQATGVLNSLAVAMNEKIGNITVITLSIGLLSAIVDNVPLVAAVQGMYSLDQYPTGHFFWEFLAYCSGTGGSVLIIGSAAGVAAMGLEKIEFFWYIKKISWLAIAGYFAGAAVFMLQHYLAT
ncbi:MAG: sodium:proton antiporter NhaD [Chitinophagaceae bacterium]|nr:sodium:proton antiporter NhaD [Chitinophagaceae bacterium]